MIVQAYTEEDKDMGLAKDIAEALTKHYPGHLWAVSVKSGVAVIKALNISSLWGYVLHLNDIVHDAGSRHKDVMRAGGEILERAKLKRGQYSEGSTVQTVDGIDNYKRLGAF
jgi:hypothetical protein